MLFILDSVASAHIMQAENSYVKEDDEAILSYCEEDDADRRIFCRQDMGDCNRGEYICRFLMSFIIII